jgi:hypothetical protein
MVSSGFQEGATHPIGFKPDLRANRDREQGLRQAQDGLAQLKLPIMIELRQGLRIKLDRDSPWPDPASHHLWLETRGNKLLNSMNQP